MAEHEANRSTSLSPELLAMINASTAAAVKEAVSGTVAAVFAQIAPLLESMAITPDKLREANKPYKDPLQVARELREMLIWKEDEAEARKLTQARQDACLHQDDNGRSSIQLVHNFPDHQPRGLCVKCQAMIHPKEWRIGAPDATHPRGVPVLVEPHKNYLTVRQLESRN